MIPFTESDVDLSTVPDTGAERVKRHRDKQPRTHVKRRMIAWDGEGIDLRGEGQPQHYVLFGCSARTDSPLYVDNPDDGTLRFDEIADYMFDTAEMFPNAWHVGYSFGYDQNMIFQSLSWPQKKSLYEKGTCRVRSSDGFSYKINYVPRKILEIWRWERGSKEKARYIKVEDIFGFWASSFVAAYESTFPDASEDEAWRTIKAGKLARGGNKWEDFPEIRRYWEYEIVALENLASGFRDMLWDNGFYLKQWYGPGAFANYLRTNHRLKEHEWGGKEENLPSRGLHHAIKCAYFGGHFEQYTAGRVEGPIYGYDINSAYPAAFCELPTMREGGHWRRIPLMELREEARNPSSPLTVFRVKFQSPKRGKHLLLESSPMPLPFRDERGNTQYDTGHTGWYWAPEVTAVLDSRRWADFNWRFLDGWQWIPVDDEQPWRNLIEPMYAKRLELKKAKNPAQMAFKLGPNSLYGKMAQRIGGEEDKNSGLVIKAPAAHTLCIAGYLTSWCRGMMLRMIDRIHDDQLIGIETDGIYTTAPPEQIRELWPESRWGKGLGEWSGADEPMDEIIYVQNGVYTYRVGDTWKVKTRGVNAQYLTHDRIVAYISTCLPGEEWKGLTIDSGKTFLGIGTAIARSINQDGSINNSKAARLHCAWVPDTKVIDPSGSSRSKRIHQRNFCAACEAGLSLADGPHTLFVHQRIGGNVTRDGLVRDSGEFRLPWETKEVEQWRREMVDKERSLVRSHGGNPERPVKRFGLSADALRTTKLDFQELAKSCTVFGTKTDRELLIESLKRGGAARDALKRAATESWEKRPQGVVEWSTELDETTE